ncbi:CHASE domain-containing protein [Aquabacterium humicola]|uniref:CHASE domain-containing protein n=1 Tax=Aquabacterium humicola TaxID=3237377 RepID=UPI002543ECEF|nr:CHASE domain-containing protein [Rubrivivax pictus]
MNTKPGHLPIRLFAEMLGIAALAELLVVLVGAPLLPPLPAWQAGLANALALVVLAAPAVYWRSMQIVRRAAEAQAPAAGTSPAPLPAERERRRLRAIGLTAVVQLGGLALTATLVLWMNARIDEEARGRFDRYLERLEAEVQRRFRQPLNALRGARAMIAATGVPGRAAFRAYAEASGVAEGLAAGVAGIGFVERVPRERLQHFIAAERADGAPKFEVHGGGSGPELYVVKYVEPLADNFRAWGVDFAGEPVRRQAIERAIDTGEPTLTGPLTLLQRPVPGFWHVLPVYRGGAEPAGTEQRRAALVGLLYAPLVAADLLSGVAQAAEGALDFELYNGDGSELAQLVFDADGHIAQAGQHPGSRVDEASYAGRWMAGARQLVIGGRLMTMRVSTTPAFEATIDRRPAAYAAFGGALLSMMAALAVWSLSAARLRAQTLAERMTADLDRLAQVVRHTQNAVIITDRDLRIQWINEGFTRISGHDLAAARGKTPGELLSSGKADPAVLDELAQAAAEGRACRVEILNRAADGREYWIDTEVQPLHDAEGRLTGFMEIGSDITDKRRATEQLAAATQALVRERQRLDAILRGTDAGTWEWNAQTGETLLNERWAGMLGYSLAELTPIEHTTWAELVHPEDLPNAMRARDRHLAGETEVYDCALRMRHRDGHWVWVETRGRVSTRTADGRPEWLAGTHMDITARKLAEAELRSNVTLMKAILENLPCGLSVFDAQLRLVAHNTQVRKLLDLPEHLFHRPETSFEEIIRFSAERGEYGALADVDAEVTARVARARSNRPQQYERLRPNGLPLEVRRAPMPGGGFVTTYTDIQERRRAEARLRDSEHLMRLVTDNMPGRIAYWDHHRRLVFGNRAFFERFGGTLAERAGCTAAEVLGAEIARSSAPIVAAVLHGEPRSFERDETAADGRRRHVLTHMIPDVRDGVVRGFYALTLDISFVKEAEAQLREANHALTIARDQAEHASLAKSRFLANMSHEIRTPMNAILGMLSLLRNTGLTERQLDYAGKAERAARALLGLLNDILDFSKVEAGKLELDPRPFLLTELFDDLSVILSGNLQDKPVALHFQIDPAAPPMLVGDDLRLQQILVNLAGNAVKFTGEGEVVVSVRLIERTAAQARLEFAVRDTGIGIAPEQQQHIFSVFSQAEASTTRRFGGTGLGLSICQRLVEMMGGTIALQSRLGEGSRFSFVLTLAVAAPPPPAPQKLPALTAPPAGRDDGRLAGLRLLLVEDNPYNQQIAQELLEAEGAQVTVTGDGAQGVAAVAGAKLPFDAVLMDLQMPVMDGFGAARAIRGRLAQTTLPIIAMTANTMSGDREACLEAGMNDHVGKPFDLDELVDKLRRLLSEAARDAMPPPPAQVAPVEALPPQAAPPAPIASSAPPAPPAPPASPVSPDAAARPAVRKPAPLPAEVVADALQCGIDLAGAVARLGGRSDVWLRSTQPFSDDLPRRIEQLRVALGAGRRDDARRVAHSLKGLAATLGAQRLSEAALAAEQAMAQAPVPADVADRLHEATVLAARELRRVAERLAAAAAAAPASAPPKDAAALLARMGPLAALLRESDMAATDAFAELQQAAQPGWQRALQPLGDAMARLDFDAALRACDDLAATLRA